MSDTCPTLDEMIFAISEVNYNSVYRPTSPPPPATDRLSRKQPPMAVDNSGTGSNIREADDGELDESDNGATATNTDEGDELGESDDDSEVDDDLQRVVSASSQSSGRKSKHLVLLDLLALLIITEPSSDVAATMLAMNGSTKFYYCKNRPCTESENEYIRRLFTSACQATPDRNHDLMTIVINHCQKKIKTRISKVARRVRELQSATDLGILSESRLNPQVLTRLRAQLGIDSGLSLKDAIIGWCKGVNSPEAHKSPNAMRFFIGTAYVIGSPSELSLMLDQKLLQRIRKLGDYLGAVTKLAAEIDLLPPLALESLVIEEVRIQASGIYTPCLT